MVGGKRFSVQHDHKLGKNNIGIRAIYGMYEKI